MFCELHYYVGALAPRDSRQLFGLALVREAPQTDRLMQTSFDVFVTAGAHQNNRFLRPGDPFAVLLKMFF